MDNKNNSNMNDNNNNNKSLWYYLIIALIITLLLNMFITPVSITNKKEINYNQFVSYVQQKKVSKIEMSDTDIEFYLKDDKTKTMYYTGKINDPDLVKRLESAGVSYKQTIKKDNTMLNFVVTWILPLLICYIVLSFIFKKYGSKIGDKLGGGFMGGTGMKKVYVEKKTGVTFSDVAGADEAKEALREIVDFLHNPGKYNDIGAKMPKGALLVGPPGTGKTLLAKAVAGEANVPFFSITGSDFVEMFVGLGASRVRDLFKQAEEKAPCIVFIDEIDAIGKSRDSSIGSNDEREQTLNQLLSEMDGFDSSKGVVILAATNRPEVLDKALLRAGRFDRRIIVNNPDLSGRVEILKVHSKLVKVGPDVDFHDIALATSGASGADLANIINEAALLAVKMGRRAITQADLFEAVEVTIAGQQKKDRILTEQERRIVSYHEVGHALAAAMQKHTQPVHKITIVPRTSGALGYTMQMPEEEKYLMSKDEIEQQIVTVLAGRAAEEINFNIITTGASNDIEKATELANRMVTMYGMTDEFDMVGLETVESKYLEGRAVRNCSEATSARIDEEVQRIVKRCHEKAKEILKDNMEALKKASEYLIEKETITGEEFMKIIKETENSEDSDKPAEENKD